MKPSSIAILLAASRSQSSFLVEVRGHTGNGGDVMNFVGHAA
ncbi:hypothetical protein [Bradyrhizobium sp. 166]|nr:hypothetical protein [Bradyrhizobium sp. 166]